MADFLNPPVINDIDLTSYTGKSGETISVVAVDDFEVATVCLTLTGLDGTLIEHGAAVAEPNSCNWRYLTLDPCSYSYSSPAPSEPKSEIRNLESETQIPNS